MGEHRPGPQPGEGGRPPKVIDVEVARRAAGIGCSSTEIAAVLGIGRRTFFDHLEHDEGLRDAIEEGRARGRAALRRLQWREAEAGNTGMLVWLGKQMLGQKDRAEIGGDPDNPVGFVVYMPPPVSSTKEWLHLYGPGEDATSELVIDSGAEPTEPTALPPRPPTVAEPATDKPQQPPSATQWLEEHRPRGSDYGSR